MMSPSPLNPLVIDVHQVRCIFVFVGMMVGAGIWAQFVVVMRFYPVRLRHAVETFYGPRRSMITKIILASGAYWVFWLSVFLLVQQILYQTNVIPTLAFAVLGSIYWVLNYTRLILLYSECKYDSDQEEQRHDK